MKTSTEYRQKFEALVAKAEQENQNHPEAYKRHIIGLAILGYAVIGSIIILLLVLSGSIIWSALGSTILILFLLKTKLIFVVAALLWVLIKSLFVRIESPQGFELKPDEYPLLWAEIKQLQKELQTPSIHKIILEPDINASIAQVPRFGLLGPYKNTLTLGLELLMALSTEQARAVLAHELAHLSGNHNKFSSWIYRLRISWSRIAQALYQSSFWGQRLLGSFVNWYVPYFNGYSFVLARGNEYEADAVASQLTSKEATASALVSTHLLSDLSKQFFWKKFYHQAHTHPLPTTSVFKSLQQFHQDFPIEQEHLQQAWQEALTQKTEPTDTHPALIDRLKALQSTNLYNNPTQQPKAIVWLGTHLEQAIDHFDQKWMQDNQYKWSAFYEESHQAREKITELAQRDFSTLTQIEQWQLATLSESYLPDEDALPLYQRYQQHWPDDPEAALVVGRLYLERNDAEGLKHIEKAAQTTDLRLAAANAAWGYYSRQGNTDQAHYWLLEIERANDMYHAAYVERQSITRGDKLIPPRECSPELIAELLGEVPQNKHVKEVWLAEKELEHFTNQPVFILAVKLKNADIIWNAEKLQQQLLETINTGQIVFMVMNKTNKALTRLTMKVGKRIY